MREILAHISLMTDTQKYRSVIGRAITDFHYEDRNDFNDTNPEAFLQVRPDGVAFKENEEIWKLFEFTRPMDSSCETSEQLDSYTGVDWSLDWAQDKDLEKNTRCAQAAYAFPLEFVAIK